MRPTTEVRSGGWNDILDLVPARTRRAGLLVSDCWFEIHALKYPGESIRCDAGTSGVPRSRRC